MSRKVEFAYVGVNDKVKVMFYQVKYNSSMYDLAPGVESMPHSHRMLYIQRQRESGPLFLGKNYIFYSVEDAKHVLFQEATFDRI